MRGRVGDGRWVGQRQVVPCACRHRCRRACLQHHRSEPQACPSLEQLRHMPGTLGQEQPAGGGGADLHFNRVAGLAAGVGRALGRGESAGGHDVRLYAPIRGGTLQGSTASTASRSQPGAQDKTGGGTDDAAAQEATREVSHWGRLPMGVHWQCQHLLVSSMGAPRPPTGPPWTHL